MNTAGSTMDYLWHTPSNGAPIAYEAPLDITPTGQHNPLAHQPDEWYDSDWIWALLPEAQHTEPVVDVDNQSPHTVDLSTLHPYLQSNAELVSHSQPTPVEPVNPVSASMAPPARSRKRKAPTLREADWEPYKKRILELHIERDLSLPEVKRMIADEFGFEAEIRQYRTRISQWKKDKNIKLHEMKAIVRKNQMRKLVETNKARLVFEVRGNQVEPQKIERWMKRHAVASNSLYAPYSEASTPSAVECRTISELSSPSLMSLHSPAASTSSSGGTHLVTQSPQMLSPALSVLSIVQPAKNAFVGQSPSPSLAYQSLVNVPGSYIPLSSILDSELNNGLKPRYKEDEENRLRDQISAEEDTPALGLSERSSILHKLSSVFMNQGRYRAAEGTIRKLLNCFKGHSNNYDINAGKLRALDKLGLILYCQGSYDKAERLLRVVLRRKDMVLGPEHPNTLDTVGSLGMVLEKQGKYVEAEAMLRSVMERNKTVLGRNHPITLESADGIGIVLQSRGKYDEAKAMHQQALKGKKMIFGSNHPATFTSIRNLGAVLRNQGEYNEAEVMLQQALEGIETIFGRNHPSALTCMAMLGSTLQRQGRYNEAKVILQQALDGREKVLGHDHPKTLACIHQLACLFHRQHNFKTALEYYEWSCAGFEVKLGGRHPSTVTCRKERDLAFQEKHLGPREAYGSKTSLGMTLPSSIGLFGCMFGVCISQFIP